MTHLEQPHSRKSQRVYRSPSSPDDPSPYSKQQAAKKNDDLMEMDAEDKEASTILMALAQHASRINTSKSRSMSIRNLLDGEKRDSSILPFQSLSNESKPFYESRRNSNLKKGFKITLQQRNPPPSTVIDEYDHPRSFRHPIPHTAKFKRNATHIHISYRIHAHQTSMLSRSMPKYERYETNSYTSAFHPAHSISTSSMSTPNSHYRDWSHHSSHSLSSHN